MQPPPIKRNRVANDPAVETYLLSLVGHAKPIGKALARELNTQGTALHQSLAWGFPCWSGNDRIFSIIAHSERCNLQLWNGARLVDRFPDRIEGTGKMLRHVKIKHVSQIDDTLRAIIIAAIELDLTGPKPVR